MKIVFYAKKEKLEEINDELAKQIRAGEYSLAVRDHKSNDSASVVTLTNRYEGIIPAFERQLKGMERRKEIFHLSVK